MADIRINSLPSTATSFNTDDYIAIDGASGGTRKMLAATLPLTDVTLGASGPSVKSSLSARAPRQGLVFDSSHGTTYATVANIPAFGQGVAGSTRGDFTFAAWVREESSFAGTPIVVIGNAAGGFYCEFNSSGIPYVGVQGGSTLYSTTACVVGRTYLLTYTRTGNTGTWYIDGVATNSLTDGINYTLPFANVSFASPYGLHGFCYPLAYNRCLSATEVKALYEAGAPSGADYNSASNTALSNGTWTNDSGTYSTFSGASATGFTAVKASGAGYAYSTLGYVPSAGTRVRVTGTLTLNNGKTVVPTIYINGTAPVAVSLTAGSFSVDVTSPAGNSDQRLVITSTGDADFTLSSFAVKRIGLLLAPDAAQAGGGLVWYDTSGNAANITLPASGVSWNVPTSGNVTSGGALTLRAGGTNQNVNLAPVGLGIVSIIGGTGTQTAAINKSGGANFYFSVVSSADESLRFQNSAGTNLVEFNKGGNVLIGTTTDAGQKLQVSGTAQFTGNVNVYKTSGEAALQADYSTTYVKIYNDSSALGLYSNSWGGLLTFTKSSSTTTVEGQSIVLKPNGTTALTLDSSQNATFAGTDVTVNGGSTSSALTLKRASNSYGAVVSYNTTTTNKWFHGLRGLTNDNWYLYNNVAGNNALIFDATTSNATFAGAIAIGNTVQTAAAVASTHKVTISIGGSTYYLLATNV